MKDSADSSAGARECLEDLQFPNFEMKGTRLSLIIAISVAESIECPPSFTRESSAERGRTGLYLDVTGIRRTTPGSNPRTLPELFWRAPIECSLLHESRLFTCAVVQGRHRPVGCLRLFVIDFVVLPDFLSIQPVPFERITMCGDQG